MTLRRTRRTWLAIAVLVLCGCGPATARSAPGATAPPLAVEAGWTGHFRPGRAMPVTVTVPGGGGGGTVEVDVRSGTGAVTTTTTELDAGATVADLGVATPGDLDRLVVRARLRRDGTTVAAGRTTVTALGGDELVGVLPGLAGAPRPLGPFPFPVPLGEATLVDLDAGDVSRPGALGPLGTVAATTADLDRMAPAARLLLRAWVAAGGRLLVDADRAPAGLPDAWRPTASGGRSPAGLGEVRLTGGLLAGGAWRTLLEPTPVTRSTEPDVVATSLAAGGPVGASLTADAGLRIPAFATLAGFLVAYLVVIGPATFVALRWRRLPERAWVVMPVIAVLVAGVVVVAGGLLGEDDRSAVATWALDSPGATINGSTVGVLSRDGGEHRLALPAGWVAAAAGGDRFGTAGVPVRSEGRQAAVSLVGGQFGVVEATGPTPSSERLVVTAEVGAGSVGGTVANAGPVALDQVVVFVGSRAVRVGHLEAGAGRGWRVDVSGPAAAGDAFTLVEARMWPEAFARATSGRVATEGAGPVNLALWGALLDAAGPNLRAPGSVVAAGWTGAIEPPLARGTGSDGHTVAVARSPVTASARLTGWEVRREVLRGPATTSLRGRDDTAVVGAVVRFALPDTTAATSPLELSVPAAVDRLDVWDGVRWRPLTLAASSADPAAPPRGLALPATALQRDVVHVRVGVRRDAAPGGAADLLLRSGT